MHKFIGLFGLLALALAVAVQSNPINPELDDLLEEASMQSQNAQVDDPADEEEVKNNVAHPAYNAFCYEARDLVKQKFEAFKADQKMRAWQLIHNSLLESTSAFGEIFNAIRADAQTRAIDKFNVPAESLNIVVEQPDFEQDNVKEIFEANATLIAKARQMFNAGVQNLAEKLSVAIKGKAKELADLAKNYPALSAKVGQYCQSFDAQLLQPVKGLYSEYAKAMGKNDGPVPEMSQLGCLTLKRVTKVGLFCNTAKIIGPLVPTLTQSLRSV